LPAPIADVDQGRRAEYPHREFPGWRRRGRESDADGDQNIINLSLFGALEHQQPGRLCLPDQGPQATVRATAESAMREVVANMSLDDAIGAGRSGSRPGPGSRMQQILDEYKSGILIQGVAIKKAVAPQAGGERRVQGSHRRAAGPSPCEQAQGYAQQLIAKAEGEAAQFDKIYEPVQARARSDPPPHVLRDDGGGAGKTDKTIVETPGVMPYLPLSPGQEAAEPDITVRERTK
jgi:membrane protease subunit HflK